VPSPTRTDRDRAEPVLPGGSAAADGSDPPAPDQAGRAGSGDGMGAATGSARQMVLRWLGLALFAAVLGTVFVNLGQWQLHRLEERRSTNVAIIGAERAPVVPFTEYFTRPITEADQWHRVQIRGTFDAEHQFVVRYRSNGEDSGYEVVTPLRADNGTVVLVDRGFVALAGGAQIPSTAAPPPTGTVTVVGHVRRNENGSSGAVDPAAGQVRLINAPAIARTLPYPIADGYIGLLTIDPPQPAGFVPVQPPELSDGPHFWYAVQWFMFTALGLAGVFVFIRSDLRARRQQRGRPATPAPQPEVAAAP